LSGKERPRRPEEEHLNDRIWPDFSRIPTPARPVLRYKSMAGTAMEIDGYKVTMEKVHHTVPRTGTSSRKPGINRSLTRATRVDGPLLGEDGRQT